MDRKYGYLLPISAGLVVLAVAFPQLDLLQNLLLAPAWISLGLVLPVTAICAAVVRSDRHVSGHSVLDRRKQALRRINFTPSSRVSAVDTVGSGIRDATGNFGGLSERVSGRLRAFMALVKFTFILPWYSRISPSPSFPIALEALIEEALGKAADLSATADWSSLLVARILPIVKDHLHHYRSVEHLAPTGGTANPALMLPLPPRPHTVFASPSSMPSATTSLELENHLRSTLRQVLTSLIPDDSTSEVVSLLAREILLGAVMVPIFEMLCDSDFWNRQIDERGGQYLREQKQVNKFLSALSNLPSDPDLTPVKVRTARARPSSLPSTPTSISVHSSTHQFDAFVKSIGKVPTLGEARRLKADVDREMRQARISLQRAMDHSPHTKESEKMLSRAKRHLDRLETARAGVEARIATLSKISGTGKEPLSETLRSPSPLKVDLLGVLSDPACLAYWLEYMDRRGRSRLVQFWLTVEGFKDPLESTVSSINGEITTQPTFSNEASLQDDVAFLYELYFNIPDPLVIPDRHHTTIRDFASPGPVIAPGVSAIKTSVIAAQQAIYEQMEEDDWPDFQRGELYRKALAELRKSSSVIPQPAVSSPLLLSPLSPASHFSPLPPPIHHSRRPRVHHASISTIEPRSPQLAKAPLPTLVNGNFRPANVAPAASVSTTPPSFVRTSTDPKIRAVSDGDRMSMSLSSLPSTPGGLPRRSSHLDILISDDQGAEKTKLFGEDPQAADAVEDDSFVEIQRMEAIQAALSEIIASDDLLQSYHDDRKMSVEPESPSASRISLPSGERSPQKRSKLLSRSSDDLKRISASPAASTSAPQTRHTSHNITSPSSGTASLSTTQPPTPGPSKRLFADDELEAEPPLNDEEAEAEGVVQIAAPGDLHLASQIAVLRDRIQDLVKQEHLLDTLIRQAELTGNEAELRILQRSLSSVRRQQRTAIFQTAQFEQQEEENRLIPGRTQIEISGTATGKGEEGKTVVKYTIEVKQVDEDGSVRTTWVVTRRYNDFYELDRSIREWIAISGDARLLEDTRKKLVELPGKKLVPNMSSSFVESRRLGLQKYLQSLVSSAALCESQLLRAFLSRSSATLQAVPATPAALSSLAPHNIVKSLYRTMATSIDDALLAPSMLDLMYTTLSRQLVDVAEGFGGMVGDVPSLTQGLLPAALRGPAWRTADSPPTATSPLAPGVPISPIGGESGSTAFTAPICDLFIEMFDLKENNWLRRQAIVVILQQFLGSTIEKRVRDSIRNAISSESMDRIIGNLQETMWPNGVRRAPGDPRTEDEKAETKARAARKLALLIPDVAANMIGRGNARRAARRVFGALQDRRLNQHLTLCIMDEVHRRRSVPTTNSVIYGPKESRTTSFHCSPPTHFILWRSKTRRRYFIRVVPELGGFSPLLPHLVLEMSRTLAKRLDFDAWLVEDNNTPWSFSNLRDAQKWSLIWIGVFSIIIVLLWKGIPCGRKTVTERIDYGDNVFRDHDVRKWKWVPILWPFKMMTVLFHEICHAVVGTITGGRVVFIRVDPWEAGKTGFRGDYNKACTLPAGYVGSCAIGAGLIWAGFDALTSKYAALGLAGGLSFSLLVCYLVKPKLALRYRLHWIKMMWARAWGDQDLANRHAELDAAVRKKDGEDHERMVSLDTYASSKFRHEGRVDSSILGVAIILTLILLAAWYFSDSLALRFIILFLGVMSSLYAIVDVWVDGVKHRHDGGSDCQVFASEYHRISSKDEERVRAEGPEGKYAGDPEERAIARWTQYYAVVWMTIQIGIIVAIVYFALRNFTSTMAQQAYESRQFLPTPNSWQPADSWARAKQASGSVADTVGGWVDGISTSYNEQFGEVGGSG